MYKTNQISAIDQVVTDGKTKNFQKRYNHVNNG